MLQQVGNLLEIIKQIFPLLQQIDLGRNIDIVQQMTNLLQQINYLSGIGRISVTREEQSVVL